MPLEDLAPPAEPAGLDIDSTVADIAESLHLSEEPPSGDTPPVLPSDGTSPPATDGTAPPPAATEPPPAAPATETTEPIPDTWRKEAKEKWATVDPVVRAEIVKREGDIAKYVGETQGAVKVAGALETMTKPYMPLFEKYGVNPWQHISSLLQGHHQLLFGSPEQKVGMFKQLASDAGIDLAAVASGTGNAENPLLSTVHALQQRLANLEAGVSGVTSTVQAARVGELEQQVLAYMQDTEAHPFFEEVTEEIKHFITTKAAKTLDEAYNLAVMANPLTKQKMIDRETTKRSEAAAASATEHAGKARKALAGNVRTSGTGRAAAAPGTIDDTLKAALAKIHARETT